jgi:glycosyltransferase involved in cell wall biosynthesis
MLARQSFSRYKVREAVVPFGTFGPSCDLSAAAEEFLAQWPDLRGRRVALSLGRIHPKKSTDILIQSFAATLERDPEWQLVIAGPDQIGWQKELEAMAADLGIANRVTWTGSLSGNMKWGAFSASEIFVLPSHQENFGIVVAEALACGLPVILSNKVNIWREIESYNAGFVGEDTVPATIATLERWSGLERNQIELLRANSRTCFTECFDYKATARKVLENVDEIARSTPRYKAANGSFIATRS